MKSLLKKFKTGGGEGRSSSSPQDAASSSSSPQDAASSSSALASASASSSAPANRKGHSNFNGGTGGARVSNSNVCDDDFNYLEEEFQVQLALAISASSSSMTPGGEESRQIKAATRLSLQCSSSNGASPDVSGESLARRYWDYNVLDYDEKILDGFYDVYSTSSELNLQGPIPRLYELQQFPISNNLDYEVVLVNRVLDPALESLEQIAACVSLECEGTGLGPVDSGLIQKVADIVANYMGGPVSDANDMLARWTIVCQELRASSNNIVLPLGCLQIGLSRHRALLFKVVPEDDWFCQRCKCPLCGGTCFEDYRKYITDDTVIKCYQCKLHYHEKCIRYVFLTGSRLCYDPKGLVLQ